MNIAVGSAFRNSARRAEGYLKQVKGLQDFALSSADVRVIAAEGDSVDNTAGVLRHHARLLKLRLDVVDASHGGPVFSSTEHPERMKALSHVGNQILKSVKDSDDVLVYVESDLLWDPATMWVMCEAVNRGVGYDSLSPLVFAGANFYDVWAYRGLNGERFSPFPPYHSQLHSRNVTEVSSVGSCLVMKAKVARSTARMTNGALVEFCSEARKLGYRFCVAPTLKVRHPA